SPKGWKIAVRCVVIGSDGSPTTSQEIWQRPSSNSCSKMRPNSPSTRRRKTYAQAPNRRCFFLKRYIWWQLKAGLAVPSRECALYDIASSRSTVDAGTDHFSYAVLESVSDLSRSWPRL